uniref:Uncharacterized protein n=1 Tax=Salmo trutta TaxID=8032 RepID=A0A673XXU5_SALTR
MTVGRQKGRRDRSPYYLTQLLHEKKMTSFPNLFCILTHRPRSFWTKRCRKTCPMTQ